MLRKLTISNFKSIVKADIPISRFTVIIGENGAGKSNILEALVMASAASKGNLERELLIARGVRVPSATLMRSAFTSIAKDKPIEISISYDSETNNLDSINFVLVHDNEPYSDWKLANFEQNLPKEQIKMIMGKNLNTLSKDVHIKELSTLVEEIAKFSKIIQSISTPDDNNITIGIDNKKLEVKSKSMDLNSKIFASILRNYFEKNKIERFTVYSPDYYTLRNFTPEGQTSPLGTRGEGLLKLLATMQEKEPDRVEAIHDGLKILGWYKEIDINALSKISTENRILVKDKYIRRRGILFDQISTNEGFLFCLFYLVLVTSSNTPNTFAIENIENGLNPKLCESLIKNLKALGTKYNKQIIISTHSPSVLDALNLDDPNDLLLAVDRNLDGHTRVIQIPKPRLTTGKQTRLSEAFLKGALGGMPKNFV